MRRQRPNSNKIVSLRAIKVASNRHHVNESIVTRSVNMATLTEIGAPDDFVTDRQVLDGFEAFEKVCTSRNVRLKYELGTAKLLTHAKMYAVI